MPIVRSFAISSLLALSLGLVAASAHADEEEGVVVVLRDGTKIIGDVAESVSGDHLSIRLPNGEVRVVAWADIAVMSVGASGSIVIGGAAGAPSAPPPPPPPPVETTTATATSPPPIMVYVPNTPPPPIVYAPPPPVVYAPPPPPGAYPVQDTPPPPIAGFTPRWTLGARFGSISPSSGSSLIGASNHGTGGDGVALRQYVSSGVSIEGDVGYRVSSSWTLYGFWEHDLFGHGAANADVGSASGNFVGVGMNANTNPHGPIGFYFDIATGYRWLTFSAPSYADFGPSQSEYTFHGIEALRLGIGASFVINRELRVDVMATGSAGYFSNDYAVGGGGSCPAGACGSIPSDRRAVHSFGGLTVAAHWDLL